MASRLQSPHRSRRSHIRRQVCMASGTRCPLHQRGLHAHCDGQLLPAQCHRPQDAARSQAGRRKDHHLQARSHRLAQALPRSRQAGPRRGKIRRRITQGEDRRTRCHRRWHVPPHHRSRQRAYGPAHRLCPHERNRTPMVQMRFTKPGDNQMTSRHALKLATSAFFLTAVSIAFAQASPATPATQPQPRPTPPTRDPHTPGYVQAKEIPDGAIPSPAADGNFIIGPTHPPAPGMTSTDLTHGEVIEFTMNSADSKYYPGIARDKGTFGTPDPTDPAKLVITTSHPAPYTRKVAVYVPKQYVPGTEAPFIVGADGPDHMLFTAIDSLIPEHKIPAMIAI